MTIRDFLKIINKKIIELENTGLTKTEIEQQIMNTELYVETENSHIFNTTIIDEDYSGFNEKGFIFSAI